MRVAMQCDRRSEQIKQYGGSHNNSLNEVDLDISSQIAGLSDSTC